MAVKYIFTSSIWLTICLQFSSIQAQDSTSTFFPWISDGQLCQINASGTIKKDSNSMSIAYPIMKLEQELNGYEEQGLYGFKDKDGRIVIEAGYEKTGSFQEGFAWVKLDHKRYYFINKAEQPLINFTFDRCFDFQNGLARVYDKSPEMGHNGFGYINEKGEIVIALQYKKAFDFVNGFALVQGKDKKWWIINRKGEKVQGACSGLKAQRGVFSLE